MINKEHSVWAMNPNAVFYLTEGTMIKLYRHLSEPKSERNHAGNNGRLLYL